MRFIGFRDKNGKPIKEGDQCITKDRTGKYWLGTIVKASGVINSPIIQYGGMQYAFKSNYETWINNQEYASELEILT